jgi:hypothetical protein
MSFALILATAVAGLVWLSIALARALEAVIGPITAAAATGLLFLIPALAFWGLAAIRRRIDSEREEETQSYPLLQAGPDVLSQLTRLTQDMTATAPIAAVAIALLGGLLAARFPAALPLLIQALATRNPSDAKPD